jgi:Cu(I)/Ag(I) efflux system membrane fusion protein
MAESISSRYAGRVERLFVKETGQTVKKGQPLFQIYSEEVETLQQDYLLQARQVAAFPDEKIYQTLLEAAANKLKLLGYSQAQIRNLLHQKKASALVTVNSSQSGIVNEINIVEGQYVSEGTPVLKLENFANLWIEADVYPDEVKSLKTGMTMKVSVNGLPARNESVKMDFIAPQADPSSQIVKVRGTIRNNGDLQPGMQATVFLTESEEMEGISVPLDAVVREEGGAHVWVKTGKGTFEPREVTTGNEDATQIIILSGLENVREVVISGAYLLTSEFVLKKGKNVLNHH